MGYISQWDGAPAGKEHVRIAGLDTNAIAAMLGRLSSELADSIRPELWARVEQLLAERATRPRGERWGDR